MTSPVLPSGWTLATLPDLVGTGGLITDGDWVESKDQDESGSIRLTQLADVGDGWFRDRSRRFLRPDQAERLGCTFLRQGDVLIARMPDPLGRACVFPDLNQRAVTVVDVCIVRLNQSDVSPKWLTAFINSPSFRVAVAGEQRGSTRKRISKGSLCELGLPVPPTKEQDRIVDALDSYLSRLDAAVATLEAAQAKLKAYRASVLKAAVEGRLVPTEAALARAEKRAYEPADVLLKRILTERRRRWEEAELAKLKASGKSPKDDKWKAKYEEPKPPDTRGLPELPEGWCWASVDQLAQIVSGQTPNGIVEDCTPEGEIPWFRVGDMNTPGNDLLMVVGSAFVSREQAKSMGLHLRPAGTIIFPKRGGAIATNKKRRLSRPSAYDLNTMGLVAEPSVDAYLWTWFLGVDLGALSDGSNVPQLNHGDIAPLSVPLPPIAEQEAVCAEVERLLSAADAVMAQVLTDARRCARLRQAVLKWAFEGKLVDQDPNEEPAEKLLERIRAERATPETPKKARRARGAP